MQDNENAVLTLAGKLFSDGRRLHLRKLIDKFPWLADRDIKARLAPSFGAPPAHITAHFLHLCAMTDWSHGFAAGVRALQQMGRPLPDNLIRMSLTSRSCLEEALCHSTPMPDEPLIAQAISEKNLASAQLLIDGGLPIATCLEGGKRAAHALIGIWKIEADQSDEALVLLGDSLHERGENFTDADQAYMPPHELAIRSYAFRAVEWMIKRKLAFMDDATLSLMVECSWPEPLIARAQAMRMATSIGLGEAGNATQRTRNRRRIESI